MSKKQVEVFGYESWDLLTQRYPKSDPVLPEYSFPTCIQVSIAIENESNIPSHKSESAEGRLQPSGREEKSHLYVRK